MPDGDSLGGWADHLIRIGVHHEGIVLENGNPSLALWDPDGNTIELVAPARHLADEASGEHDIGSGPSLHPAGWLE